MVGHWQPAGIKPQPSKAQGFSLQTGKVPACLVDPPCYSSSLGVSDEVGLAALAPPAMAAASASQAAAEHPVVALRDKSVS